jgi:hypothetical protein
VAGRVNQERSGPASSPVGRSSGLATGRSTGRMPGWLAPRSIGLATGRSTGCKVGEWGGAAAPSCVDPAPPQPANRTITSSAGPGRMPGIVGSCVNMPRVALLSPMAGSMKHVRRTRDIASNPYIDIHGPGRRSCRSLRWMIRLGAGPRPRTVNPCESPTGRQEVEDREGISGGLTEPGPNVTGVVK